MEVDNWIVRIIDNANTNLGTGFLVTPTRLVTSFHVVFDKGSSWIKSYYCFDGEKDRYPLSEEHILYMSPSETPYAYRLIVFDVKEEDAPCDDILQYPRLARLPPYISLDAPIIFATYGYPDQSDSMELAKGQIIQHRREGKHEFYHIDKAKAVRKGFSGGPILVNKKIVAILATTNYGRRADELAHAEPIESLDSVDGITIDETISPNDEKYQNYLFIKEQEEKSQYPFLQNFSKKLFFESARGNPARLQDVYMDSEYSVTTNRTNDQVHSDLSMLIKAFCLGDIEFLQNKGYNQSECYCLAIVANFGMGKSSLLANLVYNKEKLLVGAKHVFCLQFRNYSVDRTDDPIVDLCRHWKIGVDDLSGSILILDAYDELTENDSDNKNSYVNKLLENANEIGCKIIISTRPNCIEKLDRNLSRRLKLLHVMQIELHVFNSSMRKKWIEAYTKKNPHIDTKSINYLYANYRSNSERLKNSEIYGIPLFLYMIVHDNINIEETCSAYGLYTKLFSAEGIKGRYIPLDDNEVEKTGDYKRHISEEQAKELYLLMTEISYAMHDNHEIPMEKIKEIVQTSFDNNLQKWLLENFKTVGFLDKTAEGYCFAHRSIWEYYRAEKLSISFENILKNTPWNPETLFDIILQLHIGRKGITIFDYHIEKITATCKSKDEIYHFLEFCLSNYQLFPQYCLLKKSDYYPNHTPYSDSALLIVHFMNSSIRAVVEACVGRQKKSWLADFLEGNNNRIEMFRKLTNDYQIGMVGSYDYTASDNGSLYWNSKYFDLRGIDLKNANLKGVQWQGAYAVGINLEGAILKNASFQGAELKNANMKNADLSGAFLTSIQFDDINLENTTLVGTYIDLHNESYFKLHPDYSKIAFVTCDYYDDGTKGPLRLANSDVKEKNS